MPGISEPGSRRKLEYYETVLRAAEAAIEEQMTKSQFMEKVKMNDEKNSLVNLLRRVDEYFDFHTDETLPIRADVKAELTRIDNHERRV